MKSWKYAAPLALTLALAAPVAHADDITMAELPAPVRETVQREIGNAEVGEIERDDDGGATVYEVEFRENNRKFELDLSADGQVLRRHPD